MPRRVTLVIGSAAVAVAAIGTATAFAVASHQDHDDGATRYESTRGMAARVGCLDTYKAVTHHDAVDAGDCTTSTGVQIQFRIFASMAECLAWGDGTREADTGKVLDPEGFGPNWAVRIIDADRNAANPILVALTS